MTCAVCEKKLGGGFKQSEGVFLCAICTIHKVERETDLDWLQKIEMELGAILTSSKRPAKRELRPIRSKIRAIIEVRKPKSPQERRER